MKIRSSIPKRIVASLALVAAVSLTTLVTSTQPAAAAGITSCYNSPNNYNCDGAAIQRYDVCWNGSYTVAGFTYNDSGWTFQTTDRYSPQCQSNFAVTEVIGTSSPSLLYDVSNKIRRTANGIDGGYLMEHAAWTQMHSWDSTHPLVISPLVFAPHDQTEACISTDSNDQAACTGYVGG